MITTKQKSQEVTLYSDLDYYSLGKFDGFCGLEITYPDNEIYLQGYWKGFEDWLER